MALCICFVLRLRFSDSVCQGLWRNGSASDSRSEEQGSSSVVKLLGDRCNRGGVDKTVVGIVHSAVDCGSVSLGGQSCWCRQDVDDTLQFAGDL